MLTDVEAVLTRSLAEWVPAHQLGRLVGAVTSELAATWSPATAPQPEPEPTVEDLQAIEAEWPVLAAELAVVEAQCRFLVSPDVLARRALRRAEVALSRAVAAQANANRLPTPQGLTTR